MFLPCSQSSRCRAGGEHVPGEVAPELWSAAESAPGGMEADGRGLAWLGSAGSSGRPGEVARPRGTQLRSMDLVLRVKSSRWWLPGQGEICIQREHSGRSVGGQL